MTASLQASLIALRDSVGAMDNSKLLAMNRWLAALAADVILTHVPGIAGARTGRERRVHEPLCPTRHTGVPTDSWSTVEPFIDALPDQQQEVLRLHLVEGLSYRELAGRLGIPLGTVHSRVARGKQRIRAAALQRIPPASGLGLPVPGAEPAIRVPMDVKDQGSDGRGTLVADGCHGETESVTTMVKVQTTTGV